MAPTRRQLLIRFAYEGSGFRGVPAQPDQRTVGAAVRARLEAALGQRVRSLVFTARTDAGVHAVENLATGWVLDSGDLTDALDAVRSPRDDGLLQVDVREVPVDVFARTIAVGKHYRYRIEPDHDPAWISTLRQRDLRRRKDPAGTPPLPPHQGRIWQVALPLDVGAMQRAAVHLVGTHDFSGFKVGPLGDRSPVRTVQAIDIRATTRAGRPQVVLDIQGAGFLRKMVRIMVGTLAEVGAGLRAPDDLPGLLAARDRQVTGQAALARGLTLFRVHTTDSWFAEAWTEPALEDPAASDPTTTAPAPPR